MRKQTRLLILIACLAPCAFVTARLTAQSEAEMQIQTERLNRCTDLDMSWMKMSQEEQALSTMIDCAKPHIVCTDDTKAKLQRTINQLEAQNSIYDLSQLEKAQLEGIATIIRQILENCSDVGYHDENWQAMQLANLGDTLIKLGEADDAVPVLKKCGSEKPSYAGCFEKLGEAYLHLGQTQDAKAAFQHAVSVGGFDEFNALAINSAKNLLYQMSLNEKEKSTAQSLDVSSALTNSDVISMTKAGIGEQAIVLAIQRKPANFDTSPKALIALKNAGVSDKVLSAMLSAPTKANH